MLDSRTRAHLERELAQLSRLLADYGELLATSETGQPDLVARTALSSVIQSFYQGIESVCTLSYLWIKVGLFSNSPSVISHWTVRIRSQCNAQR